jgi:hypothetical protein
MITGGSVPRFCLQLGVWHTETGGVLVFLVASFPLAFLPITYTHSSSLPIRAARPTNLHLQRYYTKFRDLSETVKFITIFTAALDWYRYEAR